MHFRSFLTLVFLYYQNLFILDSISNTIKRKSFQNERCNRRTRRRPKNKSKLYEYVIDQIFTKTLAGPFSKSSKNFLATPPNASRTFGGIRSIYFRPNVGAENRPSVKLRGEQNKTQTNARGCDRKKTRARREMRASRFPRRASDRAYRKNAKSFSVHRKKIGSRPHLVLLGSQTSKSRNVFALPLRASRSCAGIAASGRRRWTSSASCSLPWSPR